MTGRKKFFCDMGNAMANVGACAKCIPASPSPVTPNSVKSSSVILNSVTSNPVT